MEKRTKCPLLSRANTGSSHAKSLGDIVLAFPHHKPTATSWSENVSEGRPSCTSTIRHRMVRERGGERVRLEWRRAVTAAVLLRDACLGGARKAHAPMPWLMGAAVGAHPPLPRLCRGRGERRWKREFPSPNSDHDREERRWKRAFSPSK